MSDIVEGVNLTTLRRFCLAAFLIALSAFATAQAQQINTQEATQLSPEATQVAVEIGVAPFILFSEWPLTLTKARL